MHKYDSWQNMGFRRVWEPNGWFWSPAEDCADRAQKYLK